MQPSSLNGFPARGIDPLAPVSSGLGALFSIGLHVLVALVCVGAVWLAWRRLRLRLRFGGLARVPLLLVRMPLRRQRVARRRFFDGERLLVGYDTRLRPMEIELRGRSGGRHHLVIGAAGSGKTVTMTWIAVRAIEAGLPAVIVDPKDDASLCAAIRSAAAAAGKELIEWSPDGPTVFNPLGRGDEGEIADKALAGETFTEPHYLRQGQRYVGHAVRALRAAGVEVSVRSLADVLDPGRLEALLGELEPSEQRAAGEAYLQSLTQRQRSDLAGIRDRLALLAESDAGRWLHPLAEDDHPSFELRGALTRGAVVLFRLRSDQRALLMGILGGAIVLDLLTTTAALQSQGLGSIAVIDEFAALSCARIAGLFARARAAGMSLVLGAQELADLELAGSPSLRKQVTGNLTTLIAHRQVNPESAEWVSRFAGPAAADPRQARTTKRRESLIEAQELRSLDVGCAAVIGLTRRRRRERFEARLGRMLSVGRLG